MEPCKVMIVRAWQASNFSENWLHFTAELAAFDEKGDCYTAGSHTEYFAGLSADYADLKVEATYTPDGGGWSVYDLCFRDVHSVDQRRAETMVKVLRRVNRALERLREQFGYPKGPAQSAAYLANALGVKGDRPFVRYVKEMRIDGTNYAHMSADSLADWLREQEAAYLERRPAAKWAA